MVVRVGNEPLDVFDDTWIREAFDWLSARIVPMLVAVPSCKWILAFVSLCRAIAPGVTPWHIVELLVVELLVVELLVVELLVVELLDEDALQLFPVISTGMLVDALVAEIRDRSIVFSPVPANDKCVNKLGPYVEE